jgi:hypothetical protein
LEGPGLKEQTWRPAEFPEESCVELDKILIGERASRLLDGHLVKVKYELPLSICGEKFGRGMNTIASVDLKGRHLAASAGTVAIAKFRPAALNHYPENLYSALW